MFPMLTLPPLFADVDWVRLAIFVVVGVGYLISFVSSRLRDRQAAKKREARPATKNAETTKELEEFFKRSATGRREMAKNRSATVSKAQPSAEARGRAARKRSEEREKRRRNEAPPTTLVNLRDSGLTKDRPPQSAGTVMPSIDTEKFEKRAEHLGHLDADRGLEDHFKDAFAHQLGSLVAVSTDSLATQNRAHAAAAAISGNKQTLPIAALLTGGNLRNAVILSEIFQRPEDRW